MPFLILSWIFFLCLMGMMVFIPIGALTGSAIIKNMNMHGTVVVGLWILVGIISGACNHYSIFIPRLRLVYCFFFFLIFQRSFYILFWLYNLFANPLNTNVQYYQRIVDGVLIFHRRCSIPIWNEFCGFFRKDTINCCALCTIQLDLIIFVLLILFLLFQLSYVHFDPILL